jgi:hypothetical protein
MCNGDLATALALLETVALLPVPVQAESDGEIASICAP